MEQLFQHGLSNAVAAALLAIVAAIATRIWRNPHFAYAAWLIVLVRLVAPPLVAVNVPLPAASTLTNYGSNLVSRAVGLRPLGPRMNAAPTANRADQPSDTQTERGVPVELSTNLSQPIVHPSPIDGEPEISSAAWKRLSRGGPQPDGRRLKSIARRQESKPSRIDRSEVGAASTKLTRLTSGAETGGGLPRVASSVLTLLSLLKRLSITQFLTAIWLGGTCGYLLLVCGRAVRFSRALRAGQLELSESLRAEADAAAATVGLRRRPRLAMLAAPLPPFVWPGWRPTVLLPQALVESLSVSQRRLLLLHEFVHLRRRDHRVRWFQIGVVALYWWNPVAWWAARRLERAEEECCDAAVLRLQPDQAEGYGQTLVAVTEFLSTGKLPAPALSIGIVRKNHLKQRLTMILSGPRWPSLSKMRFAVLAGVGAALVALTWRGVTAQNAPTSDPVTARWFKTGTKKALVPSVASPSRADVRLAALLKLEPLQPDAGDDERQKLLKERYDASLSEVLANQQQLQLGAGPSVDRLCRAAHDLFEAELALVTRNRDKVQILEHYVDYCNRIWTVVNARMNQGLAGGGSADEARARAARLEAEIRLNEFHAATDAAAPAEIKTQTASTPAEEQRLAALLKLESLKIEPGDDELQKLFKERYNAALRAVKLYEFQYDAGTARAAPLCASSRELCEAELAFVSRPADQIRILEQYVDRCTKLWKQAEAKLIAGGVTGFTPVDEADARAARYEAEIKLLRLRAAANDGSPQRHRSDLDPQGKPREVNVQKSNVPMGNPISTPAEAAEANGEVRHRNPFTGAQQPDLNVKPNVPPNSDAVRTDSPAADARADGLPSSVGLAPDDSAPLSARNKSLADLANYREQAVQPSLAAPWKQLKERYNETLRTLKSRVNRFAEGKTSAKLLCNAAAEFTDARLALFQDPVDRVPIANWYHAFTLMTWKEAEAKLHAGGNTAENRDDEAAAREAIFDARSKLNTVFEALPALMTSNNIPPTGDERQKLVIERFNASLRRFRAAYFRWRVGSTAFSDVLAAARELGTADVARTDAGQLAAARERELELLKFLEKLAEAMRAAGGLSSDELEAMHAARLDVEVELFDAKRAAGSQKPTTSAESKDMTPVASPGPVAPRPVSEKLPQSPIGRARPLPAWLTAEPLKVTPSDDDHKKLLKERYNAALQTLKAVQEHQKLQPTVAAFTDVIPVARQLLAADVALHKSGDVVLSYERYFEFMKFLENIVTPGPKAGMVGSATYEAVHQARLDAEVKLLDVKGGAWPVPLRATGKK